MLLALAAGLALAAADGPPLQIMAGKDFDALLKGVAGACPQRVEAVRYTFPAKLVDLEDGVVRSLNPAKRAAVAQSIARANCGDGAACPASAGMAAIRGVGATHRLVRAVCTQPEAYWR